MSDSLLKVTGFDFLLDANKWLLEKSFNALGIDDEIIEIVAVHTQRLFDEEPLNSVTELIFEHATIDRSMAKGLLNTGLNGIARNLSRFQQYGRDHYFHGLPVTTLWGSDFDVGALTTVLEGIEGGAVTITSAKATVPLIATWIQWTMQEDAGTAYTFHNNTLVAAGFDWTFSGYTINGTTGEYIPDLTRDDAGATVYYTLPYEIPAVTAGLTYYGVEYALSATPSLVKLWLYDPLTNVYPSLTTLGLPAEEIPGTLPVIPLRKDLVNIQDLPDQTEYESIKALCNIINIDPGAYTAEIDKSEDIAKVEDAFILFAVNVYTQTQGGMQSLYNFFKGFAATAPTDKAAYTASSGSDKKANVYALSEGPFNMAIQCNYIETSVKVGTIGVINEHTSTVNILADAPGTTEGTGIVDSDTGIEETQYYPGESLSQLILQVQLTADTYEEVLVSGLIAVTDLRTRSGTAKVVEHHLRADTIAFEKERANFSIPLRLEQLLELTIREREVLIYESMQVVIYAEDQVYLEYYETAAFAAFMGVLFLFITLVSLGSMSWINAFYAILINMGLSLVLEEVLSHNLSPVGRAAAVALYAYASIKSGDMAGLEMLLADQLMMAVTAISQGMIIDQNTQMNLLQDEVDAFEQLTREKDEELADAWDLIRGSSSDIDIFNVIKVNRHQIESPTDFYTRTIHTGNPGTISLEFAETFVDNALKLPELDPMTLYFPDGQGGT